MAKEEKEEKQQESVEEPDHTIPDDDFMETLSLQSGGPEESDEPEEGNSEEASEETAEDTGDGEGDSEPEAKEPESEPDPAEEPAEQDNQELLAGKFKTVEDLVRGYKEAESKVGKEVSARKNVERLLENLAKVQPGAAPTTEEAEQEAPRNEFTELLSKAVIGEEGVDDNVIADRLAELISKNEKLRTVLVSEATRTTETERAKEDIRRRFFEANPDLENVPDWALGKIADDVYADLAPTWEGTEQEFILETMNRTASKAREVFNMPAPSSGGATISAKGKAPSKGQPKKTVKRLPSGIQSEGADTRPAEEPDLSGEEKEIAEIFG